MEYITFISRQDRNKCLIRVMIKYEAHVSEYVDNSVFLEQKKHSDFKEAFENHKQMCKKHNIPCMY